MLTHALLPIQVAPRFVRLEGLWEEQPPQQSWLVSTTTMTLMERLHRCSHTGPAPRRGRAAHRARGVPVGGAAQRQPAAHAGALLPHVPARGESTGTNATA